MGQRAEGVADFGEPRWDAGARAVYGQAGGDAAGVAREAEGDQHHVYQFAGQGIGGGYGELAGGAVELPLDAQLWVGGVFGEGAEEDRARSGGGEGGDA